MHEFVCFDDPTTMQLMYNGMANAAVFPVPVCAQPIKSFPANTSGIDCSCMGWG
jgi:hypothetical protein